MFCFPGAIAIDSRNCGSFLLVDCGELVVELEALFTDEQLVKKKATNTNKDILFNDCFFRISGFAKITNTLPIYYCGKNVTVSF